MLACQHGRRSLPGAGTAGPSDSRKAPLSRRQPPEKGPVPAFRPCTAAARARGLRPGPAPHAGSESKTRRKASRRGISPRRLLAPRGGGEGGSGDLPARLVRAAARRDSDPGRRRLARSDLARGASASRRGALRMPASIRRVSGGGGCIRKDLGWDGAFGESLPCEPVARGRLSDGLHRLLGGRSLRKGSEPVRGREVVWGESAGERRAGASRRSELQRESEGGREGGKGSNGARRLRQPPRGADFRPRLSRLLRFARRLRCAGRVSPPGGRRDAGRTSAQRVPPPSLPCSWAAGDGPGGGAAGVMSESPVSSPAPGPPRSESTSDAYQDARERITRRPAP